MNRLYIATNNGDISGGEVMLFSIARAARQLGVKVSVIGPSEPAAVCDRAAAEGFGVVRLNARSRVRYMGELARFGAVHSQDWIWCNGLVPSIALLGHRRRINHLHQVPTGKNRLLAWLVLGLHRTVLVPSEFAVSAIPRTEFMANWVERVESGPRRRTEGPVRIGFIGRLSVLKGTDRLAKSIGALLREGLEVELHVAGDFGHIPERERFQVEQALSALPSGSLVQHGKVDPAWFYPQIDALAVPSAQVEIFGLVAAESMSARMPLLVSDSGGLAEVVGPEHPWIFPWCDDDALTNSLRELVLDVRDRPAMVRAATEKAYERWNRLWSPAVGLERVRDVLSSRTDLLGA